MYQKAPQIVQRASLPWLTFSFGKGLVSTGPIIAVIGIHSVVFQNRQCKWCRIA